MSARPGRRAISNTPPPLCSGARSITSCGWAARRDSPITSSAAIRRRRPKPRRSGLSSAAVAATGCSRPSSRSNRPGTPPGGAPPVRSLLLPRAAQPRVARAGRGCGAKTLPLRHLDDLVEECFVTVPRIGIGGGVFLGRNAVKRRQKHRARHFAGVTRRRLKRKIASIVRRRGNTHTLQHGGFAPLVFRRIAGVGVARIDPLKRRPIV